jgi:hypothetical protein
MLNFLFLSSAFVCFIHVDGHLLVQEERNSTIVVSLYANGSTGLDEAFNSVYDHFSKTFDHRIYEKIMKEIEMGSKRFLHHQAKMAYKNKFASPHCDKGIVSQASLRTSSVAGMTAFPGGSVKQIFGSDLSKSMFDLSQSVNGPNGAKLMSALAISKQGVAIGAGLMQSLIAGVLSAVPPLIPPPVWNNQPLTCVPMVTGHNCFGAVLHPITMADYVIADVTDAMLDGYIAGFPNTYASKVGKTSNEMYQACFSAYMSMLCSSIFPRCTLPQSRDEPGPVGGRVPTCTHMCILPLVMCPGFWIGDLMGSCSMVSVPPLCTQAFFSNLWRLPPQYVSFDEANPFPQECPPPNPMLDITDDVTLYEDLEVTPSTIQILAGSILPPVRS